jgi:hypothetical protein
MTEDQMKQNIQQTHGKYLLYSQPGNGLPVNSLRKEQRT